uniref:Putative secreted protein n=1 Tax=Anopheles triannulatus TaxID=58253 RepID=A0A2M4B1P9_9DIPT
MLSTLIFFRLLTGCRTSCCCCCCCCWLSEVPLGVVGPKTGTSSPFLPRYTVSRLVPVGGCVFPAGCLARWLARGVSADVTDDCWPSSSSRVGFSPSLLAPVATAAGDRYCGS